MASNPSTLRIGYVPEHYLTPLHLSLTLQNTTTKTKLPYTLSLTPFPSGTGHMITSLRSGEIDVAIGLTEGWVAGLTGKQAPNPSPEGTGGGYKVVGQWVETPLRWAVVTGRERGDLRNVGDLGRQGTDGKKEGKGGRVGVSRLGSGSHIMSFVLAQEQGWRSDSFTPVILGPFGALRDGVTGASTENKTPTAEFFMWEHFTTKPFFHPTPSHPNVPLKKIGEIFTPWPSWMIVASTSVFPNPETDERLALLFEVLDEGIKAFRADTHRVVGLLGTGELGCTYGEEDAREWLKDVRFCEGTRGVDGGVVGGVVDVLKVAGVIDGGLDREEAVRRVIGVWR
ncbi:hypothetical protein BDW59DRAFT_161335 [Aspergillus cavernicola]|uniref:Ca3427-like PBP 2 domain-containing protein n=1 Tax=Aspergillus cavernicola TaxID=176166 RepID=A0ABR4IDZ4_9EURO